MNYSKELLILKTTIRNGLPNNNKDFGNLLIKIFSLKYKMVDSDFKAKGNSVGFENVALEEYPLSDNHLIIFFDKSNTNAKSIYKVLLEISDENASITYAPLLFPITSFFLVYLSETETKNCMEKLVNDGTMLPSSKIEWNVYCQLLLYLAKKFATKAFKHIDKSGKIDKKPIFYWPYVVFYLPNDHLSRILMCYLVEGLKIFYRSGLLIWKECFNRHRIEINSSNLKDLLIKTAQSIDKTYSAQQFLNRMFIIRNFSRKTIGNIQNQLPKSLENGDWISPTSNKGYIAFKKSHQNPSQIITIDELIEIIRNLDYSLSQITIPIPLFYTNKHGYSLNSLYKEGEKAKDSLLILETAKAEIIGAYTTDSWTLKNRSEVKRYYGRGSCFVFKLRPKPFEIYRWDPNRDSATPDMFQRATTESLEIGGGGNGPSIYIDKDLTKGSSSMSATFRNPCLTPYSNQEFLIRSLEILAFREIGAE